MKSKLLLACAAGLALVAVPALVSAQGPGSGAAKISPVDGAPSAPEGNGFTCPNGSVPLVDQQPNGVNGFFADSGCSLCGGQQSIAENFVLGAPAIVGQIVLWGGYFPTNSIPAPPHAVTVTFRQDAAGLPGAVLATQNLVPASATPTGTVLFGVDEVQYVVNISPVALAAGTYWLEIFTDSAAISDDFFWETGTLDPVGGAASSAFAFATPGVTWNTQADNLSLLLCEPVYDYPLIQEIPTVGQVGLALLGLGLAVAAAIALRRRIA